MIGIIDRQKTLDPTDQTHREPSNTNDANPIAESTSPRSNDTREPCAKEFCGAQRPCSYSIHRSVRSDPRRPRPSSSEGIAPMGPLYRAAGVPRSPPGLREAGRARGRPLPRFNSMACRICLMARRSARRPAGLRSARSKGFDRPRG